MRVDDEESDFKERDGARVSQVLKDVHAHWVTQTKLNPFHDELLLTACESLLRGRTDCEAFVLHGVEGSCGGASLSCAATGGSIKLHRMEGEDALSSSSFSDKSPAAAQLSSPRTEKSQRRRSKLLCIDETSEVGSGLLRERAWPSQGPSAVHTRP